MWSKALIKLISCIFILQATVVCARLNDNSELHMAVLDNNVSLVKKLLADGASPHVANKFGSTPLHDAQSPEIAQMLIDAGADSNARSASGNTPLMDAKKPEIQLVFVKNGADALELFDKALKADNFELVKKLIVLQPELVARSPHNYFKLFCNVWSQELLALLLDAGAQINQKNSLGQTPLDITLEKQKLSVAQLLLTAGAQTASLKINIINQGENNTTWLHKLVLDNNKPWVAVLIACGADVNQANSFGSTPLHDVRSVEVAQMLIDAGADLNAKTKEGNTPLDDARDSKIREFLLKNGAQYNTLLFKLVKDNNTQELKKFIELDANLTITDKAGNALLFYARSVEMLSLLLKLGMPVNTLDKNGYTVLDKLLLDRQLSETNIQKIELLLDHGARTVKSIATSQDTNNNSWLHQEVLANNKKAVKLLIRCGVDVNAKNKHGSTPLHDVQSIEVAQMLINAGAHIHAKSNLGNTPLADARDNKIIELLLKNKADPNTRKYFSENKGPYALIRLALFDDNLERAQLLADAGADLTIKDSEENTLLADARSLKALNWLIEKGLDLSVANKAGETALDVALRKKDLDRAYALAKAGAKSVKTDLNVRNKEWNNNTWLHEVVLKDEKKWVEVLIAAGAGVKLANKYGSTPLHDAQSIEVAQLLIDAGADINARANGRTPLDDARNSKIRDLLVKNGAWSSTVLFALIEEDKLELVKRMLTAKDLDLNVFDTRGRTALSCAKTERMINMLIDAGAQVNLADKNGYTPLDTALTDKNLEKSLALLKYGAKIAKKDLTIIESTKSSTWLHTEVLRDNAKWVEALVRAGADVNKANIHGSTPLHDARSPEVAQMLISAGADLTLISKSGKTPLDDAYNDAIRDVLIKNGALLFKAVQEDTLRVVQKSIETGFFAGLRDSFKNTLLFHAHSPEMALTLINAGVSVNVFDKNGNTPLGTTLNNQVFKVLLDHGADPDVKVTGPDGKQNSIIYKAIINDDAERVGLLIKAGATIDHKTVNDTTLLHWAKTPEVIRLLVKAGLNVNAYRLNKQTPIMDCIVEPTSTVGAVQEFIDAGAWLNVYNDDGYSPLMLALEHERGEMAKLLIRSGADVGAPSASDNFGILELAVRKGCGAELLRLISQKTRFFDYKTQFNSELYKSLLYKARSNDDWQCVEELLRQLYVYINKIYAQKNRVIYTKHLKELYGYILEFQELINKELATSSRVSQMLNALLVNFRFKSSLSLDKQKLAYYLFIRDISIFDEKPIDNPDDALPVASSDFGKLTQTESYLSVPVLRQKLLEYYGKDIVRFPRLINAIISQERRFSEYAVFYHGQKRDFIVLNDVIKEIQNWVNKTPENAEFEYLRIPENQSKTVDYFINLGDAINDNKPEINSHLLPVNLSLFGNMDKPGECTFYYFLKSRNIAPPENLLETAFAKLSIDKKYIAEITRLFELVESPTGNLLQIFIPKDKINEYVYPSVIWGRPLATKRAQEETPLKPIIINQKDGTQKKYDPKKIDMGTYVDIYRHNPLAINSDDMDAIQGRIVLTHDFLLNPQSGVKIFRYNTVRPEKLKAYKQKLHEIMTRALGQWEEDNKSVFTKTSEYARNKLNTLLNGIKNWVSSKAFAGGDTKEL